MCMERARSFLFTVPKDKTMISKIDELRSIAREAAIISRSKLDEPTINLMWLRDGRISLTLYAPSLVLNDGRKNHDFIVHSIDALSDLLDTIINKAKSELCEKHKNF